MSIAPPEPSQLTPGYRLDRYELLCPIAEGGMASVWVARLKGKHGFEKLVAIKTILPKYASDGRFQQMFLDEARIASGIEHTNVAQILDLGEEHDVLYLVMEWVDGDSLSKLMRTVEKKKEKVPSGIVCRILADVCGGLHAAHELRGNDGNPLGVVHRDVSPQNVLVSTKGVAKLIDFGIAKAKDRLSGETSAGLLKGKVQYMAPEQALGQPIDARADIWAIGAILYHVFAGRPAYDGDNQLAQLHQLTSGKPPLPLPSSVPKPVVDVIKKALSFNATARFASAAEMQRALEKAMLDAGISMTTADVATYAKTHMVDRADARKKAVELALKAAGERARMAEMLRAPASPEETPTPMQESASEPGLTPSGKIASSPGMASATGVTQPDPMRQELPSVPSQHSSTLGAGVMTPGPDSIASPPPVRRRRALVYVVGVGLGVAAIIGLAALSVSKRPPPASAREQPPAIAAAPRDTAPPPAVDVPPPTPDPVPPDPSTTAVATGVKPPATTNTAGARPPPAPAPRPVSPPPRPPPPKPTAKPPAGKGTVDDGF